MKRTKVGLLGLCATIFGLLAFNAVGAQAEVGAQWLLAEKAPNSGLISFLEAEVGAEADTETGTLLTEIAGTKVEFVCKKTALVGAKLQANGSIGKGAKAKFSKCETFLTPKGKARELSVACEPNNEKKEPEVIVTKPGHGLIVLHTLEGGKKDELVLLLPDEGNTFATIEMGAECSIGTKVPVIGSKTEGAKLYLKDCQGKFLEHLVKHLVEEETTLSKLWTISETTEHVATIDGSAWAFLVGATHEGLKFSGDPA